uniref:Cns1/TTC4 wheel domain-containing protein n=1 Tax=Chaetoceros debilis TaxID=122233 RepID=A0A7S3VEM7_9STRA|mmetsp:Transcript_23996/g.36571  ORF Transcript_23996/g.36571 Transcript_23996/m.36571 type:complete len:539 (-) Transcript_23996:55-1671(-)|eukprot:CAMPEP_0194084842 /NCGR_PEP_ID=MMETSP0149-20130528/14972_1 /TAXON_ID=122233 /ORGANISM="Chaetoceros debilis, Strain MM31A-1" /LENGTH=538 /DNA_ID=CAMNT_0038767599 /DNA_START=68 /DNA_END=1684 /DNA_ORIENTATION=-
MATSNKEDGRYDDLVSKMETEKNKWEQEALESEDGPDETDALLSKAIEMAISQGKGWKPGEREEYLGNLMDDDYVHPMFAENQEELEKSGMAQAFSTLMHDEPPARLMVEKKKKGNEAFMNGKKNVAKNIQYYRDAVNFYYESFHWAEAVEADTGAVDSEGRPLDDIPLYSESELDDWKSTVLANAAMAHMQIKNWGFVRNDSTRALAFNDKNLKACYRLAKAHQMLQNWEEAGDAIDSGLNIDGENKDLMKLQKLLQKKVNRARLDRQKREKARAQRVSKVKGVWRHCKEKGVVLGRVPLVSTVTDDDEEDDEKVDEARWHHHHPHTGRLPQEIPGSNGEWSWPCMFVYPSHNHSDFVEHFAESDMIALRMAEVFPELDEGSSETAMPWDFNNEFECSKIAVYFEVHCTEGDGAVIHPECVEKLKDQGATMRFYESSRALKGDEGPEMATVARLLERKHLHKQRKAWKKKHRSLWAKPDPCPVVRVHPAATLQDVLDDARMIVPNFLVTFMLFPESHPAHAAFLKERNYLGLLEPKE